MYEIFEKLCQQKGVTPYRVGKETGITTSTLTDWKKGRYTPKQDKLQKIADYFGVTLDYLMNGEQKTDDYYFNNEAAEYAKFIFDNPEYKVLFDAIRKVPEKDIPKALKAVGIVIDE